MNQITDNNTGFKLLERVALALLAAHLIYFIVALVKRVVFPYSIDVMESSHMYMAIKFLNDVPLYTNPEEFPVASHLYPPFYYFIVAPFISVFGTNLIWGRVISIAATFGTSFVIYKIVRNKSTNLFPPIFAGLIYFMYFDLLSFTFDVVRPDTLMIFFAVCSLFFASRGMKNNSDFLMSVLFSILAIYTKQTGIFAPAAVIIFLFMEDKRLMGKYIVYVGIASVIIFMVFEYISSGWFSFWVIKNPSSHPFVFTSLIGFQQFLRTSAIITAGVRAWLFYLLISDKNKLSALWVLALFTAFTFSMLGILKQGGKANSLMPFAVLISIHAGFLINYLYIKINENSLNNKALNTVVLILIFQIFIFGYRVKVPTEIDYENYGILENYVKTTPGNIYIDRQSELAFLNGKDVSDNIAAVRELADAGLWKPDRLVSDINKKHYSLLITRLRYETPEVKRAILENYHPIDDISNQGAGISYSTTVYKPNIEK